MALMLVVVRVNGVVGRRIFILIGVIRESVILYSFSIVIVISVLNVRLYFIRGW